VGGGDRRRQRGPRGVEGGGRRIVLYHLLVLLNATGVPFAAVVEELERRTAETGLEEKARRTGA